MRITEFRRQGVVLYECPLVAQEARSDVTQSSNIRRRASSMQDVTKVHQGDGRDSRDILEFNIRENWNYYNKKYYNLCNTI